MGLEQETSGITTAQVNWSYQFAEKWHLLKPTTYRSIFIEAIGNIISPFYATGFQLKIPVSYLI